MKGLIINGPNLNRLGLREPEVYGDKTLEDIKTWTEEKLKNYKADLTWFQSNVEGEIVSKVHEAIDQNLDFIVINPGGYSHTSVAILDALKQFSNPIVEVHMSNTITREEFRHTKITAKASTIVLEGLGDKAYYFGILTQLEK